MMVGNLLLEALSPRDRALLRPHVERVALSRGDVLFRVRDDVSQVTLPLRTTIVTLVVTMLEGKSVEVATIGHEGAVGGVVSHGYLPAFTQAVVQVSGPALVIDINRLQTAKTQSASLNDLFVRYADCLLAQVLQSVACNALHPIEERCLRWLLVLQDRLGSPVLPVTHEMLAEMLGVRRSYLTSVLGALQRRGLIAAGRGRIVVKDRKAAEAAACECHGSVREHFAAVLGAVHDRSGAIVSLDATEPETLQVPAAVVTALNAKS